MTDVVTDPAVATALGGLSVDPPAGLADRIFVRWCKVDGYFGGVFVGVVFVLLVGLGAGFAVALGVVALGVVFGVGRVVLAVAFAV